jgi:hypothetical protein
MSKKTRQEISKRREAKARFQPELPKILPVESADKVSSPAGLAMRKRKGKQKAKRPSRDSRVPPDSIKIQSVLGIPDESQVDETVRALPAEDRKTLKKLLKLVAKHLGSCEAARLWLFTPFPPLSAMPLDAVRKGDVKLLLKTLESQWGRSPIYT